MLEALITGDRDPEAVADLALGKMRSKRSALREALTGRFDEHHAELGRMLLDQIDMLSEQIDRLTARVDELVEQIPEAHGHDGSGDQSGPSALERLDEIPGVGPRAAQIILAEVGLDLTQFPTAAHLVSWPKLSPRTIQSSLRTRSGRTGKGNPYLKGALGEAAAAARTDTFLGERYRRLVRRRGHQRALIAVAPLDARARLARTRRPRRSLYRPRPRLLRATYQEGTPRPRSRPPASSTRSHRHAQSGQRDSAPSGVLPRTPGQARPSRRTTHIQLSGQVIGRYY